MSVLPDTIYLIDISAYLHRAMHVTYGDRAESAAKPLSFYPIRSRMLRHAVEFVPTAGQTGDYGERAPNWGAGSTGTYWCSHCCTWVDAAEGCADIYERALGPICDACVANPSPDLLFVWKKRRELDPSYADRNDDSHPLDRELRILEYTYGSGATARAAARSAYRADKAAGAAGARKRKLRLARRA